MAKIGLNSFRYAMLTEASDGTPTYGGAKKPAKAISCSVNITSNNVTLNADDAVAESDTSFQSGTVTAGIDDEDQTTMAELLGHSVDETTGVMTRNANDVAPYVGFGRIVNKMVENVKYYKVEILNKVKFSEPNQEDATKQETIEFGTSTIEGQISTLASGKWSDTKTFNTHAEALAFLIEYLGGASTSTVNSTTGEEGETTVGK